MSTSYTLDKRFYIKDSVSFFNFAFKDELSSSGGSGSVTAAPSPSPEPTPTPVISELIMTPDDVFDFLESNNISCNCFLVSSSRLIIISSPSVSFIDRWKSLGTVTITEYYVSRKTVTGVVYSNWSTSSSCSYNSSIPTDNGYCYGVSDCFVSQDFLDSYPNSFIGNWNNSSSSPSSSPSPSPISTYTPSSTPVPTSSPAPTATPVISSIPITSIDGRYDDLSIDVPINESENITTLQKYDVSMGFGLFAACLEFLPEDLVSMWWVFLGALLCISIAYMFVR